MSSSKRISSSSSNTLESRKSKRSRKIRQRMNLTGFTPNDQKKSYKSTDQSLVETKLVYECPFASAGRDIWNFSQSLPKEYRFLNKFNAREGNWAFYHNKIGACRKVKKNGARLVHYAIGYEELGQMVKKYGDNANDWPVLDETEADIVIDENHSRAHVTIDCSDNTSVANESGSTTNSNRNANETPIPPDNTNATNAAYRTFVSPVRDVDFDATIDLVNAPEKRSIPVRLLDIENQFYGEEKRGTLLERLEKLEETVYGQSKKELGVLERLKQIESMAFETA
jgi:hypothetical protein